MRVPALTYLPTDAAAATPQVLRSAERRAGAYSVPGFAELVARFLEC